MTWSHRVGCIYPSVVPQKDVLVQRTVQENILYGTDNILSDNEPEFIGVN
ncbi:hypothetical protein HmCmsJML126_00249 [Escherichia coli]|nr:hypothetical protein HmCmsJML126_00249 [Escherichia coli]